MAAANIPADGGPLSARSEGSSVGIGYRSQRLAYPYLLLSTLLLPLMVVFGAVAAAQYLWPTLFLDSLNFSMSRAVHLNLLVFWLLLGPSSR